jgi:hypothetical protein
MDNCGATGILDGTWPPLLANGSERIFLSGDVAALVAVRMLRWRDAKADHKSWKLWAW